MRKRYSLAAATLGVLLLFNSQAFAQAEAGVPSLIIPPGARANGLGEAYVAVADDATAVWWNAGAVAFLKKNNLAFMHSQLVPDLANDVYYEFLGYARELKGIGVFSLSAIYLSYGESIATDASGGFIREFTSWEGSFTGAFSVPIGDKLGLGLAMKFIRVDYAPADVTVEKQAGSGTSFAVDTGVLWKTTKKLNLGLALSNMGPNIAFVDREQSDPLPFLLRAGLGWTAISDNVSNLLMSFDIEQSLVWLIDSDVDNRRSEIWHAGLEYRYVNLLSGRVGYIYDDDGDFNAPTYGLGFIYKDKLSLDYANVPQAEQLERVHRWSVYFTF